MSTITKEQAKDLRNAFQFWQQDYDPVEDKEQYDMFGLGMVAMDALLASLEPVSVFKIDHESSLIKHVKKVVSETNAPPAPEIYHVGDATMRHIFTPTGITDVSDMQPVFDQIETVLAGMWQPAPVSVPDEVTTEDCPAFVKYDVTDVDEAWSRGFNACRTAMLQGAEKTESPTTMQTAPSLYSSPKNAESASSNYPVIPDCSFRTCRPVTFTDSRFVVCPECGNKRCPQANDHRNACTGSNEPGQEGSAYPAAPQQEVKP